MCAEANSTTCKYTANALGYWNELSVYDSYSTPHILKNNFYSWVSRIGS